MNSTVKETEQLVNVIMQDDNVSAEEILEKILASKVEDRYDEVMQNNG